MKALIGSITFGAVVALTAGCEGGWQAGGSAQNWNESSGEVNFTGRYKPLPNKYLVSDYSSYIPLGTAGGVAFTQSGGSIIPGQAAYAGIVDHQPVVPGTFTLKALAPKTVTGVAVNLKDDGKGVLTGTGGTGTIDVNTGAWTLLLNAANTPPDLTRDLAVGYSATEPTGPGGTVIVYTFDVQSLGNTLEIRDNNGSVYKGALGAYATLGTAPAATNSLSGQGGQTVVAQFEAKGVSAAGMNVEMTGNFQAQLIVQTISTGTNGVQAQTWSRAIHGTWVETGGKTGDIDGAADPIVMQGAAAQ